MFFIQRLHSITLSFYYVSVSCEIEFVQRLLTKIPSPVTLNYSSIDLSVDSMYSSEEFA